MTTTAPAPAATKLPAIYTDPAAADVERDRIETELTAEIIPAARRFAQQAADAASELPPGSPVGLETVRALWRESGILGQGNVPDDLRDILRDGRRLLDQGGALDEAELQRELRQLVADAGESDSDADDTDDEIAEDELPEALLAAGRHARGRHRAAVPSPEAIAGEAKALATEAWKRVKGRARRWWASLRGRIRTSATALFNEAALAAFELAPGIRYKRWVTREDERVRGSHAAAHGQTIALDGLFSVGGHPAQYPGDQSLPPQERINCRCLVVGATDRSRS